MEVYLSQDSPVRLFVNVDGFCVRIFEDSISSLDIFDMPSFNS